MYSTVYRVCRPEIYKVKSNIYHALRHYVTLVNGLAEQNVKVESTQSCDDLKELLHLFDDVLVQEYTSHHGGLPNISQSGSTEHDDIRCDFCGADIFQSFFECDKCVQPSPSGSSNSITLLGDGLVLCPSCYVEGRTCRCGEMQPVQCRLMSDLLQTRDSVARAIHPFEKQITTELGCLSECPE